MSGTLEDTIRATFGTRADALHGGTFVTMMVATRRVSISAPSVVLSVGNGRFQHFLHQNSSLFRAEGQDVQSLVYGQTTYLIGYQTSFLGRSTGITVFKVIASIIYPLALFSLLSAAWPR